MCSGPGPGNPMLGLGAAVIKGSGAGIGCIGASCGASLGTGAERAGPGEGVRVTGASTGAAIGKLGPGAKAQLSASLLMKGRSKEQTHSFCRHSVNRNTSMTMHGIAQAINQS